MIAVFRNDYRKTTKHDHVLLRRRKNGLAGIFLKQLWIRSEQQLFTARAYRRRIDPDYGAAQRALRRSQFEYWGFRYE